MTSQDSILPALSDAERAAQVAEFRRAQLSVMLVEEAKRVRRAEAKLQALRRRQSQMMAAGRRAGLSWDALAAAVGITRQAVQQRVNPILEPSD